MIPFVDLAKDYTSEKKEIDKAINDVLVSGIYLNGPKVIQFEKDFAIYLRAKEAIGTSCGTDAIALALKSQGIGVGDEVIVPANVYPSVYGILKAGATPQFSDISPETLNLDKKSLNKVKISKKTKAILFVHLYGNPAGILETAKFAKENNLYLIEDCAHAHGAKINGKFAGTIGDLGCFSFYPTKNLACFGNGGAVVTASKSMAQKLRLLKKNGEKQRFISLKIGYNTQLDEIQAAVLSVKLKKLGENNKKRVELAKCYQEKLSNLPIMFPQSKPGTEHVYLNFVIATPKRDKLQIYLKNQGIETQIHYPFPLHVQPCLRYLGYKKGDFPNAEEACKKVLSLPMYPSLTYEKIKIICQKINDFFE